MGFKPGDNVWLEAEFVDPNGNAQSFAVAPAFGLRKQDGSLQGSTTAGSIISGTTATYGAEVTIPGGLTGGTDSVVGITQFTFAGVGVTARELRVSEPIKLDAVDSNGLPLVDVSRIDNQTVTATTAVAFPTTVAAQSDVTSASSTLATDITSSQSTLAGDITTAISTLATDITNSQTALAGDVTTAISSTATNITNSQTALATDITSATTTLAGDITAAISATATNITNSQTALAGDVTTAVSTLATDITTSQTALAGNVSSATTTLAGDITAAISTTATNITNSQAALATDVTNSQAALATDVTNSQTALAGNITSAVATLAGDVVAATGSLVTNTQLTAAIESLATGEGLTTLSDTLAALLGDPAHGSVSSDIALLQDFLAADRWIDKSDPSQFEFVLVEKDTGTLGVGTELLRQKMSDVNGSAIVSLPTGTPGQLLSV